MYIEVLLATIIATGWRKSKLLTNFLMFTLLAITVPNEFITHVDLFMKYPTNTESVRLYAVYIIAFVPRNIDMEHAFLTAFLLSCVYYNLMPFGSVILMIKELTEFPLNVIKWWNNDHGWITWILETALVIMWLYTRVYSVFILLVTTQLQDTPAPVVALLLALWANWVYSVSRVAWCLVRC